MFFSSLVSSLVQNTLNFTGFTGFDTFFLVAAHVSLMMPVLLVYVPVLVLVHVPQLGHALVLVRCNVLVHVCSFSDACFTTGAFSSDDVSVVVCSLC